MAARPTAARHIPCNIVDRTLSSEVRMRPLLALVLALGVVSSPGLAAAAPATAHDQSNYAQVVMRPNTAFLNAEERQVVNLLIQAADEMSAQRA